MDKTFVKGMSLVELLAKSAETKTVTEISVELGLTKSNVYRLLSTLQSLGYVQKSQDHRYELTSKIWEIGALVRSRLDVIKVSQHAMIDLERCTNETVHLSIRDGSEVVYVDKLDGSHPVRAYSSVGGRAPAWCVATGKVLLAYAPEQTVEHLAAKLAPFTDRTIIDKAAFLSELSAVRKNGYALNKGEWRDGVSGIAAPIRDANGNVIAAIGISGPTMRFRQKDMKTKATAVVRAAQEISASLGYSADLDQPV